MNGVTPLTISDWLAAASVGAFHRDLLMAARARCQQAAQAGIWIRLVTDAEFEAQLQALDRITARTASSEELLREFPLFGVPFAVKDNMDIAGTPTTAACRARQSLAAETATAVSRLQSAGAVWMGKTNLDQFATGLSGTRTSYGVPHSTFSSNHVSGGSSSGSAVAVSLGVVAFALGTDTAGSGRIPAGFNQVIGLKPTPGRVSTWGVLPACRTLDCVSIFALTVDDARQVLAVVEGADSRDEYSNFVPGPAVFNGGRSLRLGVPRDVGVLSTGYQQCWQEAQGRAEAMGCVLVPVDFSPMHETAELLYEGPWLAERYSVIEQWLMSSPDAIDPTVRAVVVPARDVSAVDTFRAHYRLQNLRRRCAEVWTDVDALLVPTSPRHPTLLDLARDPIGANAALGHYTNFVNMLGWCALALPSGLTAEGLPFGVTLIAPSCHDAALVEVGVRWQQATALPLGATGRQPKRSPNTLLLRHPSVRPTMPVAVVGAHLSGLPLNGQLLELGATLRKATATAPRYRLYALAGTRPPKPGLVRAVEEGHSILIEVWDLPTEAVGTLLAQIPPPLGLGSVELEDGQWVHGFLCESHGVASAQDISAHGGWRAYLVAEAASRLQEVV